MEAEGGEGLHSEPNEVRPKEPRVWRRGVSAQVCSWQCPGCSCRSGRGVRSSHVWGQTRAQVRQVRRTLTALERKQRTHPGSDYAGTITAATGAAGVSGAGRAGHLHRPTAPLRPTRQGQDDTPEAAAAAQGC